MRKMLIVTAALTAMGAGLLNNRGCRPGPTLAGSRVWWLGWRASRLRRLRRPRLHQSWVWLRRFRKIGRQPWLWRLLRWILPPTWLGVGRLWGWSCGRRSCGWPGQRSGLRLGYGDDYYGYPAVATAPVVYETAPAPVVVRRVVYRSAPVVVRRVVYRSPRAYRRVVYRSGPAFGYRRVVYRSGPALRGYGYRRVGFRAGPTYGYRRVGFYRGVGFSHRRVGFHTGSAVGYRRVGFRSGPVYGRMGAMYRGRAHY